MCKDHSDCAHLSVLGRLAGVHGNRQSPGSCGPPWPCCVHGAMLRTRTPTRDYFRAPNEHKTHLPSGMRPYAPSHRSGTSAHGRGRTISDWAPWATGPLAPRPPGRWSGPVTGPSRPRLRPPLVGHPPNMRYSDILDVWTATAPIRVKLYLSRATPNRELNLIHLYGPTLSQRVSDGGHSAQGSSVLRRCSYSSYAGAG